MQPNHSELSLLSNLAFTGLMLGLSAKASVKTERCLLLIKGQVIITFT